MLRIFNQFIAVLLTLICITACSKSPNSELKSVIKDWLAGESTSELSYATRAVKAIKAGAVPNTYYEEYTIIDMAYNLEPVGNDEIELTKLLINTDFGGKNDHYDSLINLAIKSRDVSVIDALLNSDIAIEDAAAFVRDVVGAGSPEPTRFVLKKFDGKLDNEWESEFLYAALEAVVVAPSHEKETAKENLDIFLGKDIKLNPKYFLYLMQEALNRFDLENLKLIEKLGGNIHIVDEDQNTLLLMTAKYYITAISEGDHFRTDMVKVEDKSKPIYEYLINNKININAVDNKGKSALIVAAESGNLPLVRLLLNNGANKELETKAGKKAIDYVRKPTKPSSGNKDVAKSMFLSALLADSGLTKEDLALMKRRSIEIRQLLAEN